MKEVTTVGLDIAKHVFQAHGITARGETIFKPKLRRNDVVAFFKGLPRCLIGIDSMRFVPVKITRHWELAHKAR